MNKDEYFKKLKFLSALFLTLLISSQVFAQEIKISGVVISGVDGYPVPGVNIYIKGTSEGTISDLEGNYSIEVPNEESILVFSSVGLKNREIQVGDKTTINVTLNEDVKGLEEVIVVGYGTQKKEDLTGAVARVDLSNASERPNTDVLQALRGNTAGVHVSTGTRAGESAKITIRGITTFYGSNEPLIVLDGVPFNGSMSDLNMNDIGSIDVLKDASSAAIYGSRATNGVILVTTKKGKSEKPTISFNTYFGIHQYSKKIKYCGPDRYFKKKKDYITLFLRGEVPTDSVVLSQFESKERDNYYAGNVIDPYDIFSRDDASVQSYDVSISGKSNRTNYYLSTSYIQDKGLLKGDDFKRFTARINLETKITDWLKLGVNYSRSHNDRSGGVVNFGSAFKLSPYSSLYDSIGNLERYPYGYNTTNPLYTLNVDDLDESDNRFLLGYASITVPFIEGLNFKINYSNNNLIDHRSYYYGRDTDRGLDVGGTGRNIITETSYWLLENIASFKRSFNKNHFLELTAMYGAENKEYVFNALQGTEFTTDAMSYHGLSTGNILVPQSRAADESMISYMARLNYKLFNRYLFTATIRRDGSSKFGKSNKFANFPSIALGWILTEEKFLKDIKGLDLLKIRYSYGKNGYNGIPPYRTQNHMYTRYYEYADGTNVPAIFGSASQPYEQYPAELQNENLKWETTVASNIGINFELLNRRLTGSVEFYQGKTYDILMNRPVPVMTGFERSFQNIGETKNSGYEITLNTLNYQKYNIQWSSTLTYFKNNNEVVSLLPDQEQILADNPDVDYSFIVGKPLFAYYDYVKDGIVQEDEIYMDGGKRWAPGSYRLRDLNGDSAITAEDRKYIGTTQPDFMASFENTVSYKKFTLSFSINMVIGGIIRNQRLHFYEYKGNKPFRHNIPDVDWWSPDNPDAKFPSLRYSNPYSVGEYENRSFGRLQDITLTYQLPHTILDKLKIKNAKIYVSGKNLVTITDDFHDWDPESRNLSAWANVSQVEQDGSGSVPWETNQEIQVQGGRGGFPLPRTIITGINFSF